VSFADAPTATKPLYTWLGVILIVVGFFGHFFAARAFGTYIYYRDHIFGFFLILLVTGSIIAGLGWRFWRGRKDITVLIIGIVQAAFGIAIYLMRYHSLEQVENADAYYREWQNRVEIRRPPKNEPWGARTFDVIDPFGNTIFVMGPTT
jgi:RsiW-degrading membrane proteinase PrsW (M82 family)